jgi:hypothetical protein
VEESADVIEWLAAVEAGRVEAARAAIMRLGTKKFGTAPEGIEAVVNATKNLTRLRLILDHIFDATDWTDLIANW